MFVCPVVYVVYKKVHARCIQEALFCALDVTTREHIVDSNAINYVDFVACLSQKTTKFFVVHSIIE